MADDVLDAIGVAYCFAADNPHQMWEDAFLSDLEQQGYVVVKAPGLSHGDELVFVPEERPRASWWWRRSVPENGDVR